MRLLPIIAAGLMSAAAIAAPTAADAQRHGGHRGWHGGSGWHGGGHGWHGGGGWRGGGWHTGGWRGGGYGWHHRYGWHRRSRLVCGWHWRWHHRVRRCHSVWY